MTAAIAPTRDIGSKGNRPNIVASNRRTPALITSFENRMELAAARNGVGELLMRASILEIRPG